MYTYTNNYVEKSIKHPYNLFLLNFQEIHFIIVISISYYFTCTPIYETQEHT